MSNFDEQITLATSAAQVYYDGGDPILTDVEYDALVETIAAAAKDDPELAQRPEVADLLTKVAAGTDTAGDVAHTRPMLSLEKVRTDADITRFLRRLNGPVTVEAKFDGAPVAARYDKGHLVAAITRGDGVMGKDVTARCQNIAGLPTVLDEPVSGEVRGEVYMSAADFEVSQAGRAGAGHEPFSNPRNAAAGLINRDEDPGYEVALSFAAYEVDLDATAGHDLHSTRHLTAAASYGFTPAGALVDTGLVDAGGATSVEGISTTLDRALEIVEQARQDGDLPIDGAVIKADSQGERDRLGEGSRAPRWAVAYKFEARKATTVMTGIERAVGRTGNVSYTALLEQVEVDGSVVAQATLHNAAFITSNDLRIGDTVEVYKAGDIIPRVERGLVGLRPGGTYPYQAPTTCPTCSEGLDTSGALWRCITPSCSVSAALDYALSRDALDVDGFSAKIADAVAQAGLATDMGDLFTITAEDLAGLAMGTTTSGGVRRLGQANADKIADGIEAAKSQPLARVITALGIRGTGRGVSRRLAAHFGSLDAVFAASADDLAAMPMGTYSSTGTPLTLGPAKGGLIAAQLAGEHYTAVLGKLHAAGVSLTHQETEQAAGGGSAPLEGMNIVVTGSMKGTKLDGLSRTEMGELITSAGGRAASSVSATTSLLVCASEGSSKWKRAKELEVRIVTPDEFAQMVGR